MNDLQQLASDYLATWNATTVEARQHMLSEHWSPTATYVDPLAEVSGPTGISAVIDVVHQQFPDFAFSLLGEVDGHHQQLRFQWGLGPDGGEPPVVGFDVIVLDEEGRIHEVRGFLDKIPA